MGRKLTRVQYRLDTGGIKDLPFAEIKAILRGADPLVMSGGRTMLAKILKGSREKKLLELELDRCPVYGFFKHLSIDEITAKIDWLIARRYLAIQYDYRLPLLLYTPMGWEIEKVTYADELLNGIDAVIAGGAGRFPLDYLRDGNREIILLILQKIEATGDRKYIPLLEVWREVAYKKVRASIGQVMEVLQRQ